MKYSHPPQLRMTYIDRLIREGKFPNCVTVASEFEVNRKTVQRDIDYMRNQGALLEYDPTQHGYYYSEPNYFLPAISLTQSDMFAFFVNVDFYKPTSFSIEEYLKDSFGIYRNKKTHHVKLKFSPYQARWIRERQWHKTQKLTEPKDGSLILGMDVEGLEEVKRWVMQYGGEVEVMEPEALREDIRKEINKMQN